MDDTRAETTPASRPESGKNSSIFLPPGHSQIELTPREHVDILLEEYRALYALALFRMGSIEKRAAAGWGIIAAFLGAFGSLDVQGQQLLLLGVPLGVLWLVRTTLNHARSFEDALRRIDQIEQLVNGIAGQTLMTFQSCHPSKHGTIGGRTSAETIRALLTLTCFVLAACVARFVSMEKSGMIWSGTLAAYVIYLVCVIVHAVRQSNALQTYRYGEDSPPTDASKAGI